MMTLSPPDVVCRVFTFREGKLSTLGHDLELDVRRFSLKISGDLSQVEATFDPSSIEVHQPALSDKDKHKIESTLKDVILKTRTHSSITFSSTEVRANGTGYKLSGVLDLNGVKRTLLCDIQLAHDELTADITLHQTDFGITPYAVMLGALRVRNDLRVVVRVPSKHLRRQMS
jgi:polyisoprenoid-binding protein YceI